MGKMNKTLIINSDNTANKTIQISLPTDTGFVVINSDDLIYIQAYGNYSKLFLTDDKTILIKRHLKTFENFLSQDYFIRIHNKYITNKSFVKAFNKKEMRLTLSIDTRLPVSVRRKKKVQKSFNVMA